MALIRLTRFEEHVAPEKISQETRETLVNTRSIGWATTVARDGRIVLMIKTVGEGGTRVYAAVNAIGNNTAYEVSAEQVLSDFQQAVQSAEARQ